jgi:hypothetical protein
MVEGGSKNPSGEDAKAIGREAQRVRGHPRRPVTFAMAAVTSQMALISSRSRCRLTGRIRRF